MTTPNATAADATILYGTASVAAMASDTGGAGSAPAPTPPLPQTERGTPTPAPSPVDSAPPTVPPASAESPLIPSADPAAQTGTEPPSGGEGDGKSKEAGGAEGAGKTPDAPPLTVDSYKDLKIPEGLTLDDAALAEFKKIALDANIDPTKAPALLDLYRTQLTKQLEAYQSQVAEQSRVWASQLDSIPEFKGERRAAAQATIGKALDQFGSPEVRELIQSYGLSNNPYLGLFIYKLAEGLQEGRMLSGGQPTSRDNSGRARGSSPGSILYPNQTQ